MKYMWLVQSSAFFALLFVVPAYGQSEQTTITEIENNPVAQDILDKIEETKKWITDLEQKQTKIISENKKLEEKCLQAKSSLENDFQQWEDLWSEYSSENMFAKFVDTVTNNSTKAVFWDHHDFTQAKVRAGRDAYSQVINRGGDFQEAYTAYLKAAEIKKIEMIQVNSMYNVMHGLAYYNQQILFNSDGQFDLGLSGEQLRKYYEDFRTNPQYLLANPDDINTSKTDTECEDGSVLVSWVTSGNHSCVDISIAKKWISDGIKGIVVSGINLPTSEIKTNSGTECKEGYDIVYSIATSEYHCVSKLTAKEMIENNTAENHTLIDYITSKDKLKVHEDIIYQINQEILKINYEYDLKKKILKAKYDKAFESEDLQGKQKMQDAIHEYRIKNITKEDITSHILEIRNAIEITQETILKEKLDAVNMLEAELKDRILEVVKGYENDPDINVDWGHLNETTSIVSVVNEQSMTSPVNVSLSNEDVKSLRLDDVGVVNSFGQKFDEIKSDQALQIAANITNSNEHEHTFAYVVEITDIKNNLTQPAQWVTGTLNPSQTFNVSLSWIPEETGEYKAIISVGADKDSVLQAANIKINVSSEGDVSDDNYCKNGNELLFKYSDNSSICVSPDTASKLINKGLAFA